MTDRCQAQFTRHPEFQCGRNATVYVHRRGRPSIGEYACTAHAGKVIRTVGAPAETVCVVVLDISASKQGGAS